MIFFSILLYFLTHAAIQVQFLQNTSTVDEGDFMVLLTIQLQLTPPEATLQYNIIIISLSVSSDSATGTVHELVTQVYCIFMMDTCCEVSLSVYSM